MNKARKWFTRASPWAAPVPSAWRAAVGKRLALLLTARASTGEDDRAVFSGIVIREQGRLVLDRGTGQTAFDIRAEWLEKIRPVAAEMSAFLQHAEYYIPLTVEALPTDEEGFITTGLRQWPTKRPFIPRRLSALPWRTKVAIALVLILAGYSWYQYRESVRIQTVAENTRKGQQLKAQIDRQFVPGTPEPEVLQFLRTQHPDYITWPYGKRNEYGVPLGQEPSDVWYCGHFTAYVILECEAGRLARTRVARWSTDCL